MKLFKIHGVILSVHFLFIPIMLSLYLLGHGKEMIVLLAIIMMHELAHGLAAIPLGIRIQEIQILPFGGVVKLDKTLSFTLREEVFISAAGPISNMVLSATGFFLQEQFGWKGSGLDFIIYSSLFIGIFNLMPALPLDGGRILRSCLSYFVGYKNATRAVVILSKIFALCLIGLNMYILTIGIYHFTIGLVGIFIYFQSRKEQEIAVYSTMKDIATKKDSLNKAGSMDSQHMTVLPQTTLEAIFKQFTPKKFHIIYVLDEQYALKGIITEDEILSAILRHGLHSKVKIILEKRKQY